MLVLTAFVMLVGCDSNGELARPTPPPVPLAVSTASPAEVRLTGTVEVVSIKNGAAPVTATLTVLDGELALRDRETWSGALGRVEIALTSFDSALPLRDDRVRNTLLQVARYPTASFELTGVSGLPVDGIPVGGVGSGSLAGSVRLAGSAQALQIPVTIERTGDEAWTIATREPVGVSLRGFGLQTQADALKVECGHESIDDVVRVGFSVVAAVPPAPPAPPAPADLEE